MRLRFLPSCLVALISTAPALALAHAGGDGGVHHGFVAGFLHPLTGGDHLAAMLAVGGWSAMAARSPIERMAAPLGFAALLLLGALLAWGGLALPGVEPMIAASLLLLGLLLASRRALPPVAAAGLVGAFALFHGAAHGQELASQAGATGALAGMLAATVLLHLVGLAAGTALRRHAAGARLAQAAGAGCAVFGLALLGGLA